MADRVSSDVRIEPVGSKRQLNQFIALPERLYGDCPNYVPPLRLERRQTLSPKKNPYFQHATAQYWLAYRDGRPVGRISAQVDDLYLSQHRDATGHFGFLDAEDDPAVFAALLDAAEAWLRDRGMERVRGPFNLSINEECGLLVEGFDEPAMLMMGFSKPHTAERLGERGYTKAKDLIAYDLDLSGGEQIRGEALLERMNEADRVKVRPVDMSRYKAEVAAIMAIFNDAWADNWSFVPFTEAEISKAASDMRPLIRPELNWIAEIDGEPACMMVCLPNLFEAIADLHGRLLPFGWLKLLTRLKASRFESCRIPLMGLRRCHQRTLLGSAVLILMLQSLRTGMLGLGLKRVELSWILEDNMPMRRVIEDLGARAYKTYRIFEKSLV
jgi:hypothetical protein